MFFGHEREATDRELLGGEGGLRRRLPFPSLALRLHMVFRKISTKGSFREISVILRFHLAVYLEGDATSRRSTDP